MKVEIVAYGLFRPVSELLSPPGRHKEEGEVGGDRNSESESQRDRAHERISTIFGPPDPLSAFEPGGSLRLASGEGSRACSWQGRMRPGTSQICSPVEPMKNVGTGLKILQTQCRLQRSPSRVSNYFEVRNRANPQRASVRRPGQGEI